MAYTDMIHRRWGMIALSICILVSFHAYADPIEDRMDIDTYEDINIFDPLEEANRAVFGFNQGMEALVFKPLVKTYVLILPMKWERQIISSLLANLEEPCYMIKHLLQGNGGNAFSAMFRFLINSTVGVLGLFDVAAYLNVPRVKVTVEDVLAYYHVGRGPYIVVPFWGPSSLRGFIGSCADILLAPWDFYVRRNIRQSRRQNFVYGYWGLTCIVKYDSLLTMKEALTAVSLDEYSMVKSVYWQTAPSYSNHNIRGEYAK